MGGLTRLAQVLLGLCALLVHWVSADNGGKGTCGTAARVVEVTVAAGDTTALRNEWECAHNRWNDEMLTINLGGDISLSRYGESTFYGLYLRPGGKLRLRKAPGVTAERVAIQRTGSREFGLILVGSFNDGGELILEYVELKSGLISYSTHGAGLKCAHSICRES